jgi:transposase
MNLSRNQHTASKKVEILREHLENQVPISELSRRYGVNPSLINKWKKQLFEGAVDTFSRQHEKVNQGQNARIGHLEEKIKDKDSLIAEVLSDNIRLKKKLTGEI